MSDRGVERDYILGTDTTEIERLGVQHDAWRPMVLECWRRAAIGAGSRVLDVGAGPGYASCDLAKLVGPTGSVTAVERSGRFAAAGRERARRAGLENLEYLELDLMADPLPDTTFDSAWCRWVCSFLEEPAQLVTELARVIRPGGVVAFHEYVDYASWRFSPGLPLVDEYIEHVMASWRADGGEPDVATSLPPLLGDAGFVVRSATPHVFCVGPGHPMWRWIAAFIRSNTSRLAELGACDESWLQGVRHEFETAESDPSTLLLTPMVLEVIAERRR